MSTQQKLKLYDSMSRTYKEIIPIDSETFRFYCCGPTVYGPAHIGNFRTFVTQDLFRRVVELGGIPTKHVRNITDVDDKTIRQSQLESKTLSEFTAHWTIRFQSDARKLNMLEPDAEVSAVAHIPEQIELIQRLEAKGLAYTGGDGSVYFRVSAYEDYGKLSRLKEREITSTEVVNIDADEYSRDTLADFALWKARKPEDGDNYWESPWGEGRPGWHIECSAMAIKELGESFDLHSGGIDLLFPHHENEIAQSEGATGKRFANHWFHVTHLMVDGAKMSKSKGNLYTLNDIEERGFSGADLRYTLQMGHYRKQLNFTWESLTAARRARERIGSFIDAHLEKSTLTQLPTYETLCKRNGEFPDSVFSSAWNALLDDMNTSECYGAVFKGMKEIESSNEHSADALSNQLTGLAFIMEALGISPEMPKVVEAPDEIVALAAQRWEAKKQRDWAQADSFRDQLTQKGWSVKDTPDGYELKKL